MPRTPLLGEGLVTKDDGMFTHTQKKKKKKGKKKKNQKKPHCYSHSKWPKGIFQSSAFGFLFFEFFFF
jgi:hypothetical protein